MFRKWLTVALIACSTQLLAQQNTEEFDASSANYISDDLFTFMHTGPGRNYRILGSVDAGTPITILQRDTDSGYTEIRDNQDRTGWVDSDVISNQISRREQLPQALERLANAQTELQAAEYQNTELNQQLNDSRQQIARLTSQVEEQTQELNRVKQQLENASKDEMFMWFTRGGMVAGAGILLGIILTYLPKKRRRNNEWA
ncbi:TIGR04211 family SH3 domain-containing protein [Alteromonas aestuariivivens]|uniref:TIGR04211 family SH3 domain-containing protein n=1 Tax=Alteromonas aestuariivivens TaxID=1938339 RepID=A0A3D8MCS5_9ALTE|nr:TIGR04211 family SH3 domain-containing protein [Alteromonas aestuariivivens]RDV28212.1 TIGR04211 family SH3 domain-containing protein [Alteromonas aestuariivivens]